MRISRSPRWTRRCAASISRRANTCVWPTRSASSRNLPKELVSAFRATLEELEGADLLVHVIDASNPDWPRQRASVEEILRELKLDGKPVVLAFNKADAAASFERSGRRASRSPPRRVTGWTGCAKRSRGVSRPPGPRAPPLPARPSESLCARAAAARALVRLQCRREERGRRSLSAGVQSDQAVGRVADDAGSQRRSEAAREGGRRLRERLRHRQRRLGQRDPDRPARDRPVAESQGDGGGAHQGAGPGAGRAMSRKTWRCWPWTSPTSCPHAWAPPRGSIPGRWSGWRATRSRTPFKTKGWGSGPRSSRGGSPACARTRSNWTCR